MAFRIGEFAGDVKNQKGRLNFQTAFAALSVVTANRDEDSQEAAENVVDGDEDGQRRADVAVFTAVNNGTHLPHNHQGTEDNEAGRDGQAQGRDVEEDVGHNGNHEHDRTGTEEAAEFVHVHCGAACHGGHGEEYTGGHGGGRTDDLRAVINRQGVLQHRADGKAHAESEDHQQGYADVAVTVFLDQEGHAVEEAEEGGQGNPR